MKNTRLAVVIFLLLGIGFGSASIQGASPEKKLSLNQKLFDLLKSKGFPQEFLPKTAKDRELWGIGRLEFKGEIRLMDVTYQIPGTLEAVPTVIDESTVQNCTNNQMTQQVSFTAELEKTAEWHNETTIAVESASSYKVSLKTASGYQTPSGWKSGETGSEMSGSTSTEISLSSEVGCSQSSKISRTVSTSAVADPRTKVAVQLIAYKKDAASVPYVLRFIVSGQALIHYKRLKPDSFYRNASGVPIVKFPQRFLVEKYLSENERTVSLSGSFKGVAYTRAEIIGGPPEPLDCNKPSSQSSSTEAKPAPPAPAKGQSLTRAKVMFTPIPPSKRKVLLTVIFD
jgi:hydroxyacyl-ACP dehydratase HTD2-like protein with hotdog domain